MHHLGKIMVFLVVLGAQWAGLMMANLLMALQVNLGWPLSAPLVIPLLGAFLSMTVNLQKSLHPLNQMMFLMVFLLTSRILQVQIKSNHLLNLSKTLLKLGYRIRQQALLMQLMKMPILLPLKFLN